MIFFKPVLTMKDRLNFDPGGKSSNCNSVWCVWLVILINFLLLSCTDVNGADKNVRQNSPGGDSGAIRFKDADPAATWHWFQTGPRLSLSHDVAEEELLSHRRNTVQVLTARARSNPQSFRRLQSHDSLAEGPRNDAIKRLSTSNKQIGLKLHFHQNKSQAADRQKVFEEIIQETYLSSSSNNENIDKLDINYELSLLLRGNDENYVQGRLSSTGTVGVFSRHTLNWPRSSKQFVDALVQDDNGSQGIRHLTKRGAATHAPEKHNAPMLHGDTQGNTSHDQSFTGGDKDVAPVTESDPAIPSTHTMPPSTGTYPSPVDPPSKATAKSLPNPPTKITTVEPIRSKPRNTAGTGDEVNFKPLTQEGTDAPAEQLPPKQLATSHTLRGEEEEEEGVMTMTTEGTVDEEGRAASGEDECGAQCFASRLPYHWTSEASWALASIVFLLSVLTFFVLYTGLWKKRNPMGYPLDHSTPPAPHSKLNITDLLKSRLAMIPRHLRARRQMHRKRMNGRRYEELPLHQANGFSNDLDDDVELDYFEDDDEEEQDLYIREEHTV